MWPDQVLNSGPLTYESGALPTALRCLAMPCVLTSLITEELQWLEHLWNHEIMFETGVV